MTRSQQLKWLKMALGCSISIALALLLGLSYATSAGVITLLSIQNTKRETLLIAIKRLLAFGAALLIAWGSFSLLGYGLISLGVYVLAFTGLCIAMRMEEVIAICTVLIAHFWADGRMDAAAVLNDTALLLIGLGTGITLNLFMPHQIQAILSAQRSIEQQMQGVLSQISQVVLGSRKAEVLRPDIQALDQQLHTALVTAYEQLNNTFTSDLRYHVQYIEMRRQQFAVLQKMIDGLEHLHYAPEQAQTVAALMQHIAQSFHEYNNAVALLGELDWAIQKFRQGELPATREEFETRAVLFRLMNDLEYFLRIKRDFAQSLTPEQKAAFWVQQ